jgi:hypothetical protein
MAMMDIWTYREPTWAGTDLSGFSVEALDGGIGHVHEATNEVGGSYVVVDTGPWIFGKKVLIPAGAIDRVHVDEQKGFVDRTKDEIKDAPEFDESRLSDPSYREQFGGYYASLGGARDVQV